MPSTACPVSRALTRKWDAADEGRRIGSRARTVGEFWAIERPLLKPLPDEPFETGRWLTPRVDRFASCWPCASAVPLQGRLRPQLRRPA